MRKLINYISTFFKCLLLILFLGYYGSITMFYHAHLLVNGVIITHSHPFKSDPNNKGPFQSHSHSSSAYNLIDQLNQINWNSPICTPAIPEPPVFYSEILHNYTSPFLQIIFSSSSQLRAPPVC
jgi:hypothetical protein